MIIKQIPVRNNLKNYMYLLVCDKTLEAIAIDPLDHALCLRVAEEHGWSIKVVANTHHHYDHIDGNPAIIAATGAELVAHKDAMDAIPNVDRGLLAGDELHCGEVTLKIMDTPGHTLSHICLLYEGNDAESPALFCGDTLFNAGVGRCDFGGEPNLMYQTFVEQIFQMDGSVRVFPGHDYIENNLAFTLDREPGNQVAKNLLAEFNQGLDAETYVTTLSLEHQINVFFRLSQVEVRQGIAESLSLELNTLDDRATFVGLRQLRDKW